MFQTKVGTVLTESGVEVQMIVRQNVEAQAEGKTSDRQQFYPAIMHRIIIEFFINTFCIPLL